MSLGELRQLLGPWLESAALFAGLVAAGLAVHWLLFVMAARFARRTRQVIGGMLVTHVRPPSRLLVPLVMLNLAWPSMSLPDTALATGQRLLSVALIAAGAWLLASAIGGLAEWVTWSYRIEAEDNLRARQVQTQTRILRRVAQLVVLVVASALILLKIPGIEDVGASLLASAGLAGIVVGLAARPTVTNVLAGLQLALTQPIRIDDVVVIQGEWGRIEEIRTTYVVVRIWDLRRLVVPLSAFIEAPFENWTRVTADLLATVFVHVDYTTSIDEVRSVLKRILDDCDLWDGKTWNLQVTDAGEHTLQLRALMSAPDSGTAWNLRCHVREQLVGWLQQHRPGALPRRRADVRAAISPGDEP